MFAAFLQIDCCAYQTYFRKENSFNKVYVVLESK